AGGYSPYLVRSHTPDHAGGVDFSTGNYTRSIRAGDSKLANSQAPAAGIPGVNPLPNLNLSVGLLQTGPSPQNDAALLQTSKQVRYDGTRPWEKRGPHTIHFGGLVSRIETGGFTATGAFAPSV